MTLEVKYTRTLSKHTNVCLQKNPSPSAENVLLLHSPAGHSRCRSVFSSVAQYRRFSAEIVVLGDSFKSVVTLRVTKAQCYSLPVAPDDDGEVLWRETIGLWTKQNIVKSSAHKWWACLYSAGSCSVCVMCVQSLITWHTCGSVTPDSLETCKYRF